MRYEQIADLLNGVSERFGWDKVMEGDNIIGLKQVNCLFYIYIRKFIYIIWYASNFFFHVHIFNHLVCIPVCTLVCLFQVFFKFI